MNFDKIRLAEVAPVVDWLRGRRFGSIEVLDAWASIEGGANDKDVMVITVVVTDPPAGMRSWPYEDWRALHQETWNRASETDLDLFCPLRVLLAHEADRVRALRSG